MKANFYLAKFITPIILGFLLGASVLVLISYTQDSLQKFFPSSVMAYANFRDGRTLVNNKLYQHVADAIGDRSSIDSIINELAPSRGGNLSIGLITLSPQPTWLMAASFDKAASILPLTEFAKRHGLFTFQIIRQYSAEQVIFLSNTSEAISEVSDKVGNPRYQALNIGTNLRLGRLLSSANGGNLMLNIESIKNSQAIPEPAREQFNSIAANNVDFDLSQTDGNFIITNATLLPETNVAIEKPEEITSGFVLRGKNQAQDSIREILSWDQITKTVPGINTLLTGIEQREAPQNLKLITFNDQQSWVGTLDWHRSGENLSAQGRESANQSMIAKLNEQTIERLTNFITTKNQKEREVVLPDYSTIREVVRDTESVKVEKLGQSANVTDLVGGDKYWLESGAESLTMAKNYLNTDPVQIKGCKGTIQDSFMIVDLQKTLLPNLSNSLGKMLMLVHDNSNSTGYPQISFCFY